jgi:hypothetical protein
MQEDETLICRLSRHQFRKAMQIAIDEGRLDLLALHDRQVINTRQNSPGGDRRFPF